jgi:hypothetical protein
MFAMANNNFTETKNFKKGEFAEKIVTKFLEEKGYVVYKPETEGAHAFDRLAIKDKQQVIIAEVKAKAKRKHYDDTGFNITHYNEYIFLQAKHNIPAFVFFVDEELGEIYGNFIKALNKPVLIEYPNKKRKQIQYPSRESGIIFFPLVNMKREIYKLSQEEIKTLQENTTKQESYKKTPTNCDQQLAGAC